MVVKFKPYSPKSAAFTEDIPWLGFRLAVLSSKSVVFAKPFAGLTKPEVLQNKYIERLWLYWSDVPSGRIPAKAGALGWLSADWEEQDRVAKLRLYSLLDCLWDLAQLDDAEVRDRYEEYLRTKRLIQNHKQYKAIRHLKEAAIDLGLEPDYFIRRTRGDSYRRFEDESPIGYATRVDAIRIHDLMAGLDFVESKRQSPSFGTLALRAVWPKLHIDVPTLKQLFMTEKEAHRHALALRSIVNMASPGLNLSTGYIEKFLSSVERDASL